MCGLTGGAARGARRRGNGGPTLDEDYRESARLFRLVEKVPAGGCEWGRKKIRDVSARIDVGKGAVAKFTAGSKNC